jgi:N-methylhydantoinase A/oxoprolinase/acetone carboxylase beta subunit
VLIVDIDVGGTLTDGIFSRGQDVIAVKVDTTPHDLTVCLLDCLTQGATELGFRDLDAFLEKVDLIRWSTTITSNVLAEQRGPRLGLIVSRGHGKELYGDGQRSLLLGWLLDERHVIEVDPTTPEVEIRNAVRSLLEGGVRRICVSLAGSDRDAQPEHRIKRIIEEQYPDHFLGAVPVLAGSDICRSADDRTRTYCALVNAYTHGALAATLFKAEDELRQEHRYAGSFFVSHINGGVAGISKTRALDTMESGPVLGLHASRHLARALGLNGVIALDVGGTTAKVGVLQNAEPIVRKPSNLFGLPLEISLPYLHSIALGGGSVVKPAGSAASQQVTLGPESMGSYPGPACYGLGGERPTLTDAFFCAGLINPDYFLGGSKPIDLELARHVIQECVAAPLRVSPEEASRVVIRRAFMSVAEMVLRAASGLEQSLANHSLFAYGGNGGLFACGVAELVGMSSVYFFLLGPVFSAFGSSVSDICHVYERAIHLSSLQESEVCRLRQAIEDMRAEGVKDLLGEGIQPAELTYTIELEVSPAGRSTRIVSTPEAVLGSGRELRQHLARSLREARASEDGDALPELARLQVRKWMPKPNLVERPRERADSSRARKGTRPVVWGSTRGTAQLHEWELLRPGNRVEGCAVLESAQSTYFVPEGWCLEMDSWGNGKLHRP